MMNVIDAIRTKRAVRQFQAKPLPDEMVTAILDAGRRAPSARNRQPWHFIAIRERATLQALVDISPNAGHLAGAALGVVIVTPNPQASLTVMFDTGQAATYMQLAAWELGVASCIGSIQHVDPARDLLGFPSEMHMLIALSFGYPLPSDGPPPPPKTGGRRPLAEVVHWEKW
jgi:nitroreductase